MKYNLKNCPPCWVDWHEWCCQKAIKEWIEGFEAELREMMRQKFTMHAYATVKIKEILGE